MVVTEYVENKRLSFASESIHVESKILPDKVMCSLSSIFKIRLALQRKIFVDIGLKSVYASK
jgi:hypothetical protein